MITINEIVEFILNEGNDFDVTIKDIMFVGEDTVVNHVNAQLDGYMKPFDSKRDKIAYYFADAFSQDFDKAFAF